MNIPLIRLEVEGMQHSISVALAEHQLQMDADVQQAIKEYCNPENIRNVIMRASSLAINNAITQEVEKFFSYGNGRRAIAAAVEKTLLSNEFNIVD